MANYVLLFVGGNEPQSEAEGQAVMQAWTNWFTKLGSAVVDPGNPFAGTVKSISSDGRVSNNAIGTPATGYTIIKADSMDAATNMAKDCPQLKSGGQISVYEITPVM